MADQPHKAAFYFGCIGTAGHFLHGKGGAKIYRETDIASPWSLSLMDTRLLKNGKHPDRCDGKVFWTCGRKGDTCWFAFFWWDRSVDSRPGSNSGFYVSGFPFAEIDPAFAFACRSFPGVIARQKQPLALQEKPAATLNQARDVRKGE